MNEAELDLLVLSAQGGKPKAFGLLFAYYYKPLLGFAIKLSKDPELAKDAVQDAWVKASKNLYKLNDPRAFKSWIYRLVRWKVLDFLKRQSKESACLEQILHESSIEFVDSQAQEGEVLSHALALLPMVEKQIIHLFYLDELTIAEISVVIEIPVGTVKSRLNRARKLLKKKCQQLEN